MGVAGRRRRTLKFVYRKPCLWQYATKFFFDSLSLDAVSSCLSRTAWLRSFQPGFWMQERDWRKNENAFPAPGRFLS